MNPVLERLFSPSPKDESYHIITFGEMPPLNARQKVRVPLSNLRMRYIYICLVLVMHCALGHIPAEVVDNRGDVGASTVRAIEQLSNEVKEREQLGVHGIVIFWLGDCLGCHVWVFLHGWRRP